VTSFPTAIALAVLALLSTGAWLSARRGRREAERRAASASEAQRLLISAFDAAPAATLLTEVGLVRMANRKAREMFAEGVPFEGQNFLSLLGNAPAAFRDAMLAREEALFTIEGERGDTETFHLRKHQLTFDGAPHVLLVVEQVTRELRRQEVDVWKRLLRTISHELNNSLAPISSMVHSARLIADQPEHLPKLARVFDTIEERTRHLQEFIDGYVHFARMPKPRLASASWRALLQRVQALHPEVTVECPEAATGWFDAGQIEQVLINLVKNALEAGGPASSVVVTVVERGEDKLGAEVTVVDRGPGMSPEVLESALLPFYSTKERGTGLGLALCREIVEAHEGRIRLQNREGGGLVVTCSLPGKEAAAAQAATARLTLTRV
jgi:two-component system nitrogen regulation sensor histidine kinase NtrY